MVEGVWAFITAGHCLNKAFSYIDASCDAKWHVHDRLGMDAKRRGPRPFVMDRALCVAIEDDSDGADFGAVFLRELECDLMKANGAVPFDSRYWGDEMSADVDAVCLFGVPAETVRPQGSYEYASINQGIRLTPLANAEVPSKLKKSMSRLFARVPGVAIAMPDSIVGMSGGPWIGIKEQGDVYAYWLIGIQSTWMKARRLAIGVPLCVFSGLLADRLKSYRSKG